MEDKKLTDDEIWWLISDFANLSEEEKASKLLGVGDNKSAYDLGNGMVLKQPHKGSRYEESMVKDYIGSKHLAKHLPVETPTLIKDPNYGMYLLQKKLTQPSHDPELPSIKHPAYNDYQELANTARLKDIDPNSFDFHPSNIGYDNTGKAKILDTGNSFGKIGEFFDESPRLQAIKKAAGKLASTPVNKTKIYRSIAGALPLAGTAMALSSGDVSAAASELPSEIPVIGQVYDTVRSDNAGSAEDDKMMINEVNARKNYDNSPAHQARLQALKGYGK